MAHLLPKKQVQNPGDETSIYDDFSCILAYTMNPSGKIMDLLFGQQIQNNVLILQFVTPWVSELARLSIYADIFRRLVSGTNFKQNSIFSSIPLVIPQECKNTLILALL